MTTATHTPTAAWQDEATSLVRSVLGSEFADTPVYVLPFEDATPAKRLALAKANGCAGSLLDAELQTLLASRGQWRGRGCAMLLSDHDGDRPRRLREILETAIHEAAHFVLLAAKGTFAAVPLREARKLLAVLPAEPDDEADFVASLEPELRAAFLAWPVERQQQALARLRQPTRPAPPWLDHGLQFIRCCSLLARRASSAGFPCRLSDLRVAGPGYGLSSARSYERALGHEAVEREHDSLLDVLKSPAPMAAQRLFQRDTAAHVAA